MKNPDSSLSVNQWGFYVYQTKEQKAAAAYLFESPPHAFEDKDLNIEFGSIQRISAVKTRRAQTRKTQQIWVRYKEDV